MNRRSNGHETCLLIAVSVHGPILDGYRWRSTECNKEGSFACCILVDSRSKLMLVNQRNIIAHHAYRLRYIQTSGWIALGLMKNQQFSSDAVVSRFFSKYNRLDIYRRVKCYLWTYYFQGFYIQFRRYCAAREKNYWIKI